MELVQAELVAECSLEEIDEIESDPDFLREIKLHHAISEMELLEKHEEAMELQVEQGKTSAVQWKLERVNPRRWGKDDSKDMSPDLSNLNVNLKGKHPDK
jgi:hypothetical protein